jgi:hypothetical protein
MKVRAEPKDFKKIFLINCFEKEKYIQMKLLHRQGIEEMTI